MPKPKSKNRPPLPRRFLETLDDADLHIENEEYHKAIRLLKTLTKQYPNEPGPWQNLAYCYQNIGDHLSQEEALYRFARLKPNSPDAHFWLGTAYLQNDRLTMAKDALQTFLHRWPHHEEVEKVKELLNALDQDIQRKSLDFGLPEGDTPRLMRQSEEVRFCLDHQEYPRGLALAQKAVKDFPNFPPLLNNLSLLHIISGEIDQAIGAEARALTVDPDNVHALANMAWLYFFKGDLPESSKYAELMKASKADATDRWGKIAETLAFLGDDGGIVDIYEQAKKSGDSRRGQLGAHFYHLLAAANWNLGKSANARRYWRKALEIDPNFDWARQNLDDVDAPAGERHGAWYFPHENWMLGPIVKEIGNLLDKEKTARDKASIQKKVRDFLDKHPEVRILAPHLLQRGDAKSCEFVYVMASASADPELLALVKAFIEGKRGSLKLRMEAAQALMRFGLMDGGAIKMWNGNEFEDLLLLDLEISPESHPSKLSTAEHELMVQAWHTLRSGDGKTAQPLWEKLLKRHPDDPALWNNLAAAYTVQDQDDKALEIQQEIRRRFPDYFFGIINEANLAIGNDEFDRAREMLTELMKRKKLHTSEFTALAMAQIKLALADENIPATKPWLEIWEKVDPEDPQLENFRNEVKLFEALDSLKSGWSRKGRKAKPKASGLI